MGTALITGASAGLGAEFARLFAKDGHDLILVARRLEPMQKIKAELTTIKVQLIDHDLSIPNGGELLYKKVQALNLQVDFLVNNAGSGSNGDFRNLPLEREINMIGLNVRSLVELTHCFLKQMIERKSGRILNVGSMAGYQPGPFMATYYATKAFVNSFSEALHEELQDTGVTCSLLTPGPTATEFADAAGMKKSWLFNLGVMATAQSVAELGYRGMHRGYDIIVPGLANQILFVVLRVTPRIVARKVAGFLNSPQRAS